MGFVRCGIFHILMDSESLENAGMFTLQRGGSIQALVCYSVQVRSGIWAWISRKVWSDANEGSGEKSQVGSDPAPSSGGAPNKKRTTSVSAKEIWGSTFVRITKNWNKMPEKRVGLLGRRLSAHPWE